MHRSLWIRSCRGFAAVLYQDKDQGQGQDQNPDQHQDQDPGPGPAPGPAPGPGSGPVRSGRQVMSSGQVRPGGPLGPPGYHPLGSHLEVSLAPLGPPGGPLGSKCPPGPSLDSPRTLQESLQEPPGADLGPNLEQLGANLGPTCVKVLDSPRGQTVRALSCKGECSTKIRQ